MAGGDLAQRVTDDLYHLLRSEYVVGSEERLGSLSISDVGGCGRRAKYKMTGVVPTEIPPSVGALHDGKIIHVDTQQMLTDIYGKDFHSAEEEVKVGFTSITLTGHVDGILRMDGGENFLIEVKSSNTYGWKKRWPLESGYAQQYNSYLHGLATDPRFGGVVRGLVIYRKKGFLEFDAKEIAYDEKLHKQTDDKVSRIVGAGVPEDLTRILPDLRGNLDWRCNYCPYRSKCWGADQLKKVAINKWAVKSYIA